MRRPFVKLKYDPRSSLPLRPALSRYEKHRFAEAIGYLEARKKGRRDFGVGRQDGVRMGIHVMCLVP
jgi:hypothetical protein